jgi:hypothetical protein
MASSTPSTIVLRSNNRDNGMQRVHEAPCQAAVSIKPGMLLAYGTTNTIKPHATAVGNREGNKVAIDNWQASGSGLDTVYAAGETVRFLFASPGDVLYMLIKTGSNVAKGAALESAGTGALQAHTTPVAGSGIDNIVGYAEEAVNNATGSDARIRVRMA